MEWIFALAVGLIWAWIAYRRGPKPETFNGLQRIILPLMRKIMPNIIAYEITGVQPMTGPVGSIFPIKLDL